MRQFQPERVSPFRMPYWFRWVALACALFLTFDYFVGGWNSPDRDATSNWNSRSISSTTPGRP